MVKITKRESYTLVTHQIVRIWGHSIEVVASVEVPGPGSPGARKPGCPEDGRVLGEVLGVLHGEVLGVLHGEVLGQGRLEPSRGAVGCSLV